MMKWTALVVVIALLGTGCGGGDEAAGSQSVTSSEPAGTVAPGDAGTRPETGVGEGATTAPAADGGIPVDPGSGEPAPVTAPEGAPVPGELVRTLVEAVARDTSADPSDVEVLVAQQVVWNDGSLGCPRPGQSSIQVLTSGYWVVLQAGGLTFDYRAAIGGEFSRCLDGGPPVDVLVDR